MNIKGFTLILFF